MHKPLPRLKTSSERSFLGGPQSRLKEFIFTLKVVIEFIKGFRVLHFTGPSVTIFGSARFPQDHPYCKQAEELGAAMAHLGFTVMTGGGPGIMEAANRGAKLAGGKSVGCNIELKFEQEPNKYLDTSVDIKYFFVRKTLLVKYSYAFIVLPGGFGTLDELFEALTLIQTDKIEPFPVVLFGKEYHAPLMSHILKMKEEGAISPEDINLMLFTEDVAEAVRHIEHFAIQKYGLIKG
jgi:uncharacterized protein (TIGR00730 family)